MVLGFFEEEKVFDFVVVGGQFEKQGTKRHAADDTKAGLQVTASQAVWQKTPMFLFSLSRLAPSQSPLPPESTYLD